MVIQHAAEEHVTATLAMSKEAAMHRGAETVKKKDVDHVRRQQSLLNAAKGSRNWPGS